MALRAKEIQRFQEIELERGIFDTYQSFHNDFRDCPWIIVRGLSFSLSEGDIATIFEQYGTIVSMELVRDEKTGASRGTCLMAYEDPRSAVLAIDNLNGITLLGRTIAVDHQDFKPHEKSKLVDPRTITPARLQTGKSEQMKPIFDQGSAASTESFSESDSEYGTDSETGGPEKKSV
ncbi:RNA-binding motif protein, X-linked 2 [Tritrichomonas musculus]|uniref:RNA-binding motif protein, X-linked 2 n=1 Tax=Tritrichomonas musculus TaxID=1915356 RepID=A0ABR2KMI1_9EUKA